MDQNELKAAVGDIIVGLENNIDDWGSALEDLNEIDLKCRQAGAETPQDVCDAIVTLENDQDSQDALAILNELHASL